MIDLKSGFYNAIDNDRTYNAEDMNMPYSRIISNGVMAGEDFHVLANNNLTVTVKKGFGLFDKHWAELENDTVLTIPTPNVLNPRIDSVIVRNIDRKCTIEYVQGEATETPIASTLNENEYRLATIYVSANAVSINQTNIEDTRPTAECGFITNLLWNSDITSLYDNWREQFLLWFDNLKTTLVNATAMVSLSSKYITQNQDETVIPINIERFNSITDILQVYINGLICIPDIDYTFDNFENITLKNGVDAGTTISFIVYKSVDGSQSETVISQVNELYENLTPMNTKLNAATTNINSLTTKVNTATTNINSLTNKVNNATARADSIGVDVANLTSEVVKLKQELSTPLWKGANTMGASASITPSKKLSACRNGWLLVWSGYNTSTNKATETRLQFTYIPKSLMANLTAESMPIYANLIYTYYESGNFDVTAKLVTVTDSKITGFAGNVATDFGKGICLMAVMEW